MEISLLSGCTSSSGISYKSGDGQWRSEKLVPVEGFEWFEGFELGVYIRLL